MITKDDMTAEQQGSFIRVSRRINFEVYWLVGCFEDIPVRRCSHIQPYRDSEA